MSTAENKAVVRQYFELFHNQRRLDLGEQILGSELLTPTLGMAAMMRTAFPDCRIRNTGVMTGIGFRTQTALEGPPCREQAPVVGGRGAIAGRHAPELDDRGASARLAIEGNSECFQPLTPTG